MAFKTLLEGILEDAGMVPVAAQTEARKAQVTGFINQGLDMAYPWLEDGWPELRQATLEPVTVQVIALADVGGGHFGVSRVLGVSVEHPWRSKNPRPVGYTETGDGIVVGEGEGGGATSLWVAHIEQPPVFTLTAWVTGTQYYAGEVRLRENDCYVCLADHLSDADFRVDLAAEKWAVLKVPGFLNVPLRAAVAEHLKRSAGQEQTAGTLAGVLTKRLGDVAMRYR